MLRFQQILFFCDLPQKATESQGLEMLESPFLLDLSKKQGKETVRVLPALDPEKKEMTGSSPTEGLGLSSDFLIVLAFELDVFPHYLSTQ